MKSYFRMSRVERYELLMGKPYGQLSPDQQALVTDVCKENNVQLIYKWLDELGIGDIK